MQKHFEIKSYEKDEVTVLVQIDYDNEQISLVEKLVNVNKTMPITQRYQTKKWTFVNRELEYMSGWRTILGAMEYAIGQAEAELKKYVKAKNEGIKKFQQKVEAKLVKGALKKSKNHEPQF